MCQPLTQNTNEFDRNFDRAFSLVAFAANRHLMNHMRRTTIALKMDLEMAYIWGSLAHSNVARHLPYGADPMLTLSESGQLPPMAFKPVRLTDLCQITGFSRETVRRKLIKLQAMGRVEHTTSGGWVYLPQSIDESVHNFTKETVLQLLATAQEITNILNRVLKTD
jgi:hypothetical protein